MNAVHIKIKEHPQSLDTSTHITITAVFICY